METQYHVEVIRIDPKTGEALPGAVPVRMTSTPCTLKEAYTIRGKLTSYPWRSARVVSS